jgi:type I restriction enzyme, S subunit
MRRSVFLKEVLDFTTGKLNSNRAQEGGEYPFFTCSPDTLRIETYSFDTEAVLLAGNNANGVFNVKYYKGKFDAYQRTYVITPKNPAIIDCRYAYYQIRFLTKRLREYSLGTATRFLTLRMLHNLAISLPPIAEQHAISNLLGSYDNKIQLNAEMNAVLEEIVQTIFKHWFINFEFPNEDGEPYKSNGGMMKTSELGEIPSDWLVAANIADLCSRIDYGYTQRGVAETVGPKFLRVTDINKADWISWGDVPYCEINEKDLDKYTLHRGDIVIARMADPGKIAIFDDDIKAVFASYLIRVRPRNPEMAYYLYYLLKSKYYQYFIVRAQSGSVQKNLNAKRLTSGLHIILPSLDIARKFSDLVRPFRSKISANCREAEVLKQIRDSILPRMMNVNIKDSASYIVPLSNIQSQTSLKQWP